MEHTAVKTGLTDQELDAMAERVLSEGQFDLPAEGDNADEILTDEYGLPFEPEGCYNSAPLAFEEMTQALWIVTNNAHYAATRYNRHSPTYMLLSDYLDKNIRQLGSCCITKAVLEKSGEHFAILDRISLHELYCMVSLHFRKCVSAYNDIVNNGQTLDMNIIRRLFRWAALAERLKATEDKIQKIQDGKINIDSMLDRARVYKNEPKMRRDRSGNIVNPKLRASSLPVMKSYAKEIRKQKIEESKQERARKLESERARKRLEKAGFLESGTYDFPPYPAKQLPKIPGIGLNEKELKQLLMDEAKSRGNMAEAGIIAAESFEQHLERFMNLQKERQRLRQNQAASPENKISQKPSGPSAETRKKLREKRRKKK